VNKLAENESQNEVTNVFAKEAPIRSETHRVISEEEQKDRSTCCVKES
jgi:hypothetical protein